MMQKREERSKKEEERGTNRLCNLLLLSWQLWTTKNKTIRTVLSKKHDLRGPVFKNQGRQILHNHTLNYNCNTYAQTWRLCEAKNRQ